MNTDSLVWSFLAAILSTVYFFLIKYYTINKKTNTYSCIVRTFSNIFIL